MADNTFLVAFGSEGVEMIYDATHETGAEEREIIARLKGEPFKEGSAIAAIQMRCRMNSHRKIELYGIKGDIEASQLWEMFDKNEDYAKDLIRSRGVKIGY